MRAAEVEVCLCCYEKDECMWIVREGVYLCVCVHESPKQASCRF